jgi:hypothetical protein
MMDKYMMGERDDTRTATYINGQNSNLYLSLIYMWDKMYNFVFVEKKDPLPAHIGIGDIYTGENVYYSNDDEEALHRAGGNSFNEGNSHSDLSMTTPRRSPLFGKRDNNGDLVQLMNTM